MRKRISQREAHKLAAEVRQLRADINKARYWSGDYLPGGVQVAAVGCSSLPEQVAAIRTARKLGHAVVAVVDGGSSDVRFMALPLPKRN